MTERDTHPEVEALLNALKQAAIHLDMAAYALEKTNMPASGLCAKSDAKEARAAITAYEAQAAIERLRAGEDVGRDSGGSLAARGPQVQDGGIPEFFRDQRAKTWGPGAKASQHKWLLYMLDEYYLELGSRGGQIEAMEQTRKMANALIEREGLAVAGAEQGTRNRVEPTPNSTSVDPEAVETAKLILRCDSEPYEHVPVLYTRAQKVARALLTLTGDGGDTG